MRVLVILVVVAVAAAAPKKPIKSFPKKYDAAKHGGKDTYSIYSIYSHTADEDSVLPEFSLFKTLLPPLPPPGYSSYASIGDMTPKDALSPPPEDTYSSVSGVRHIALVPPPVFPAPEPPSSYLTYEGPAEEGLVAPPLSSYDHVSKDASGTEVLASLAAMIQALPRISSYSSYQPAAGSGTEEGALPRHMLPPPPYSSYSSLSSKEPSPSSVSEVDATPLPSGLVPPPVKQQQQ